MKLYNPLEVNGSPAHGTLKNMGNEIDILIVYGENHEKCFEHANNYIRSGQRFTIVITHDESDFLLGKRSESIFKGSIFNNENNPFDEPNITDPESNLFHVGYLDLKNVLNGSKDLEDLKAKVSQLIN